MGRPAARAPEPSGVRPLILVAEEAELVRKLLRLLREPAEPQGINEDGVWDILLRLREGRRP